MLEEQTFILSHFMKFYVGKTQKRVQYMPFKNVKKIVTHFCTQICRRRPTFPSYGHIHAVHTNLELEDARLIRQVSSKTNSSNVPSGYNVPNIVIEAGEDGGKYRV